MPSFIGTPQGSGMTGALETRQRINAETQGEAFGAHPEPLRKASTWVAAHFRRIVYLHTVQRLRQFPGVSPLERLVRRRSVTVMCEQSTEWIAVVGEDQEHSD
jgi:hypothetical protein